MIFLAVSTIADYRIVNYYQVKMSEKSAAKGVKDWHSSKDIAKRARHLLEHPDEHIPSDVTFLVGDGQDEPQKMFRCHKFMLAMVSSMFQAMFYGSFPQTEDIVKVPDVIPKAFQHMLRYAYGDNIDLDDKCLEDALDTLYCAKKYLIAKLTRACRDHIQLQIVVFAKDPCVVFQRAPQMDEDDLAVLALSGIALYTPDVMRGDALLGLSFDCMKQIVDYPHLNGDEIGIYQGVRRWVEHNVGAVREGALREAFGSSLYSIRFPLFSATELADGPVADGVLTDTEASRIFQFLFAQIKPTLPFPTAPRSPLESADLFSFELVMAPSTVRLGDSNMLILMILPDLAPKCWVYLAQLVSDKAHIRIASIDNEHVGKTVPLPAAVQGERNVLTHSIKGACWFEWDVEDGAACNVRIGAGKKPHVCHSAVFGFVQHLGNQWAPFDLWDDKRIQGIRNFSYY